MTRASAQDDANLIALFRSEAAELLDTLDSCLLDLLSHGDDSELIDRAFRSLHTLKGTSTMYGYDELSEAAHALEGAFAEARRSGRPVASEDVELALREARAMRSLLISTDSAEDPEDDGGTGKTPTANAPSGDSAATQTHSAPPEGASATRRVRVLLHPSPAASARGLRLGGIVAELASLGECVVSARALAAEEQPSGAEHQYSNLAWCVELATEAAEDRVREALMFLAPAEFELEELIDSTKARARDRRTGARARGRRSTDAHEPDTIRVASHRLDELVNLVGELVTAHGSMASLAGESSDSRLTSVAEEIGRLAGNLRENALSMRMIPIGTVFGRFRRHVHDLGNELGKQAELVMEGGETELDKGVLDHLAEPILHILRNSLDHGIEAPGTRTASGKSPVGSISLQASQAGGRVHVVVTDDGMGIDFARVREKAVARDLIAPNADLPVERLSSLLFDAGFSTSEEVTSVSGRGVGLDVVKRTLDGLHGSISLTSAPGQGTTIALSLPLTLAIIDGLISTVGSERYVIPLAIVEECAEVVRQEAWRKHERDLLEVQGRLLPLVHLRSFFEVPGESPEYQIAVIVCVDDRRFGIVVDGLVDSVQTVIKPLGAFMKRADGVSGTTVLGDGGVVPIIDPAELVRIADFEQVSQSEGGR
jgi:two-component system chemotaxis sensor kinase CheA